MIEVKSNNDRRQADAVPNRPHLYALKTCNEAGVTHGPALARHITELIFDGKTQLDRHRFSIDRF